MNTLIYLFVGFVLIMIFGSILRSKEKKKSNAILQSDLIKKGYDISKFIKIQKYVGGHPEISAEKENVLFYPTEVGFDILNSDFSKIGSLINSEIKDILVENKSTIEKRLSVTNIALFGVFGLAMQKSKSQDISFLTIKNNDGRFNYEILFSIEVTKQDLLNQKNEIAKENIKNRSRSDRNPLSSFEMANELKNKMVIHLKSIFI